MSSALEDRIEHLEAEGIRAYDAPAFDMVLRLLERAEALPPQAAARLRERATARLRELSARFVAERDQARDEAARLSTLGVDDDDRVKRALERGELRTVRRAAKRHRRESVHPGRLAGRDVRDRLAARVGQRSVARARLTADAETDATALVRRSARDMLQLAELLYHRSSARTVATATVKKELAALPEEAGRYHGETIAARALSRLSELAPSYLRARLGHLAALEAADVAFGDDA